MSAVLQVAIELSFLGPIVLFAIGFPAAFFNAIIFIGTKTFRQSSSAYYVVGQSLSDVGVLLVVILQSIPSTSTSVSSVSCKLMLFISQVTVSCAMTFLCLAAFDRWTCTSRSARVRQLSSTRIARCLFPFLFVLWSLINIPYLIFCDLVPPTFACSFTNDLFARIAFYFLAPILSVLLPLIVLIIFGLLTYHNICLLTHFHVQQNPTRTRLSMWEQQMTRMMIVQTVLSILCTLPRSMFLIYSVATIDERATRSLDQIFIEILIDQLTVFIMSLNFASSFYIFFLSSPRLRQTIKMYIKRIWNVRNNQVGPMHMSLTAPPPLTTTQNHERHY
jgi:hypothetical protein